jgi:hypothetical protein
MLVRMPRSLLLLFLVGKMPNAEPQPEHVIFDLESSLVLLRSL